MRYHPLTDTNRNTMLSVIGLEKTQDLFSALPETNSALGLPKHRSEIEVERIIKEFASQNISCSDAACFLGGGNYRHHTPAALDYLIQRGEFLTAYTPYQPEISQGTLQTIFEFQTQVALMMDMDVANASMYDGATACAEACAMACRITKRTSIHLCGSLHPHYRDVTSTQLQHLGLQINKSLPGTIVEDNLIDKVSSKLACIVVQNPGLFGDIVDLQALANACHSKGVLLVVCVAETLSLGSIKPPGAMGADIVIGEGQSLSGPLSFGGPGLGLFATRQKYLRQMPGRICGETTDENGQRGFVLTLATREQHIRREKATSNICTNSGLVALAFSIHMALLGEKGFTSMAHVNHTQATNLADELSKIDGVNIIPKSFFNEFAVTLPISAELVVEKLIPKGLLAGIPMSRFYPKQKQLENILIIATTEMNTQQEIDLLISSLKEVLS